MTVMIFIFDHYFILYLLINIAPFNLCETNNISKLKTELTVCQQYSLLFENNDAAKLVDITNGTVVNLLCHFCEDKNIHSKQTWYYKKRGLINSKASRVINDKNIYILPSKDLLIGNFNDSFSGIYTCKYSDEFIKGVFTYILDEVFDHKPIVGVRDEWERYKINKMDRMNDNFKFSKFEPFKSLRKNKFLFELVTIWDDWRPCEAVTKRKGLRRRDAKCRLKSLPYKLNRSSKQHPESLDSISRFFLQDKYGLSCRSVKLNKMLPGVSRIVNISDYELIEGCDVETDNKKYFSGQKRGYKHKIMKQLGENGHLNLICPEVEKYSHVEWFKNNVLLNSTFRNNIADSVEEPHLTIDSYNTLYILHATKNEEALYSCIVDGERILLCDVRVVSKSRLLNQEFIRYSIYLGFVLSLTLSCYCAGIFVAWHRRVSFADPLSLNKQKMARRKVKK